ncbi:MAG: hypothetical protein DYG89_47000 [Caldilinea sp. CFX5]|nr:hypothetical protein [Caldilinea sp. CFX5]
MTFVETPIFTELVQEHLSHDSYVALQQTLILRPDAGNIIPGSRGLRKLRWRTEHGGKRGGLRVIYYWYVEGDRFFRLFLYKKNEQEDLRRDQIQVLRGLVEEYLS